MPPMAFGLLDPELSVRSEHIDSGRGSLAGFPFSSFSERLSTL